MIYLGSIMFFRREKYRLVSVLESFSDFHFSTIIAVSFNLNLQFSNIVVQAQSRLIILV